MRTGIMRDTRTQVRGSKSDGCSRRTERAGLHNGPCLRLHKREGRGHRLLRAKRLIFNQNDRNTYTATASEGRTIGWDVALVLSICRIGHVSMGQRVAHRCMINRGMIGLHHCSVIRVGRRWRQHHDRKDKGDPRERFYDSVDVDFQTHAQALIDWYVAVNASCAGRFADFTSQ